MNASTAPLSFRRAVAADVPAIVALVESAYRGDASRAGWTTEADMLEGQRTDPDSVLDLVGRDGSRVILAEAQGELLACAHVDRVGDSCYFGMFSVRPSLQGGGIGRALLAECERVARVDWGCRSLHMTVIRQRDELIAWYERRGYHRTGETRPFPYGDPRFGVPLREDLAFIVLEKPLG